MSTQLIPIDHLPKLRGRLKQAALHGFVQPKADAHQNEFIADADNLVEFFTGFTGSFASTGILEEEAAFFTDGRYRLQAGAEIPPGQYEIVNVKEKTQIEWLAEHVKSGMRIGFDPRLLTEKEVIDTRKAFVGTGAEFVAVSENPIVAMWENDRPKPPLAPVIAYGMEVAGESSADKRARMAKEIVQQGNDALVMTDPALIAWLLNVRGGDLPDTPLTLGYAILRADGKVDWFVNERKAGEEIHAHLGPDVKVRPHSEFYTEFKEELGKLGASRAKVRIDYSRASHYVVNTLRESGAILDDGIDPCVMGKAIKNEVEIEGMRSVHIADGAALAKCFAWVAKELTAGHVVTEMSAAEKLEEFRKEDLRYLYQSFGPISSVDENAPIIHRHATPKTNTSLNGKKTWLIDSGGQYYRQDLGGAGTTDVTRTIRIGEVTPEIIKRYTQVLQGHIAVATAHFPAGTPGLVVDGLARQFLQKDDADFDHGTGHDVDCMGSVHGTADAGIFRPQISPRTLRPLQPGMIRSNEPGYYKDGEFGMRIENLVVVKQPNEKGMLSFETITVAPLDPSLVDASELSKGELNWFNAYQARVYDTLAPYLEPDERAWLRQVTMPLVQNTPA